jgi:peroxiredoxin
MRRMIFSLLGMLIVSFLHAQQQTNTGMKAPEFQLPYATKDTIVFDGIHLSEYQGTSIVLLAFYPVDWSGGCTQEAIGKIK